MDYNIENMDSTNAYYYAKVSALAWKESYKGIVDDDYLSLINNESEIIKMENKLNSLLDDGSRRFLLKYNDHYVGILRVRITKYDNYKEYGELGALYLLDSVKGLGKMIIGCLSNNPSNEFYKHMGSSFIGTNPITLPNGQLLEENLYTYDF